MARVCPSCFTDSIFKRRLMEVRAKIKSRDPCDRHPKRKGVELDSIGPTIDAVFRANFGVGEYFYDRQEGDELWAIIEEITGATDDELASSIAEWLIDNDDYWPPDGGEPFYAQEQTYVRIRPGSWEQSALWRQFRQVVLNRQRFFNEEAKTLLAEIFDGVHLQVDENGQPTFYELTPSPDVRLHRARVVVNEKQAKEISKACDAEMGTPPPHLRRAGRMNAAGIPVFYGALEEETAVAELRPAVGAELCIANFELRRPLRVLDFTRFSGPGKQINMFSLNYLKRKTQWAFMLSFANEISKPILPRAEHLEYVPTQIVAEYLSTTPMKWKGKSVFIDAIVFHSAQRPQGRNIAILGDACLQGEESRSKRTEVASLVDFEDLLSFETPHEPAIAYSEGSLKHVHVQSALFAYESLSGLEIDYDDRF